MNKLTRKVMAGAAALGLVLGAAGGAHADQVESDVVASGNGTITTTTSTTINYWVLNNNAGGLSGCDISSSTPVTFAFVVPAEVTTSVPSLTFTSCGDSSSNTQSVTFSSTTAGSYPINHRKTAGPHHVNANNANWTLTVNQSTAADTTPPTIAITTPANNGVYKLNQVVNAAYQCTDAESLVTHCAGTVANGAAIDTSSVGLKTFTVNSTSAGGTSSATHHYRVEYAFVGFDRPVDNFSVLNRAKAGQAIPLKWRLLDFNGVPVTGLSSVALSAASLSCSSGTSIDQVEEYAPGSSGLQNLGDGYYQINWKTPTTYSNSCKTLQLNLGEGGATTATASYRTALFQFTK